MAEHEKDWTIMIYMAGDNNLSVDMSYALQQIKNTITDMEAKVNLLVYYDGAPQSIPTLYCDFSDDAAINYYRSYKIENKLYEVEPEFDENSAAARSVINFVDWCVNKVEYTADKKVHKGRKAKNYALIFSGHTFGFQNIGLFKDESSNYYMTMRKINWLLERITKSKVQLELDARDKKLDHNSRKYLEETTPIIGQTLDILGFDSCVMGMLEVGYEFTSVAKTMVASEGSIPNAGWTYAQIFKEIFTKDLDGDITKVARKFVEQFILTQNKYAVGGVSVDMAAWDLNKLDLLDKPIENLVESLNWCFEKPKSVVYKQMKRLLLQVHYECQSYMSDQNIDLGDFCKLLIKEITSLKEELKDAPLDPVDTLMGCCQDVLTALKQCVILSGFSGGNFQYSNGISLFFPWSLDTFDVAYPSYKELNFIKTVAGKKWKDFLNLYLSEITLRPSKPEIIDENEMVYLSYRYEDEEETNIITLLNSERVFTDKTPLMHLDNLGELSEFVKFRDDSNDQNTEISEPLEIIQTDDEDETTKTPEAPRVRTPEAPRVRTPEDRKVRTPEDRRVRMLSDLGLYFNQFVNYKNIETRWNLSGFSKLIDLETLIKNGVAVGVIPTPEDPV